MQLELRAAELAATKCAVMLTCSAALYISPHLAYANYAEISSASIDLRIEADVWKLPGEGTGRCAMH